MDGHRTRASFPSNPRVPSSTTYCVHRRQKKEEQYIVPRHPSLSPPIIPSFPNNNPSLHNKEEQTDTRFSHWGFVTSAHERNLALSTRHAFLMRDCLSVCCFGHNLRPKRAGAPSGTLSLLTFTSLCFGVRRVLVVHRRHWPPRSRAATGCVDFEGGQGSTVISAGRQIA